MIPEPFLVNTLSDQYLFAVVLEEISSKLYKRVDQPVLTIPWQCLFPCHSCKYYAELCFATNLWMQWPFQLSSYSAPLWVWCNAPFLSFLRVTILRSSFAFLRPKKPSRTAHGSACSLLLAHLSSGCQYQSLLEAIVLLLYSASCHARCQALFYITEVIFMNICGSLSSTMALYIDIHSAFDSKKTPMMRSCFRDVFIYL